MKVSDIASVSQQAVTPIESYSIVDGNPAVIVQVTGSFDQRIDQYVSIANAVVAVAARRGINKCFTDL